MKGIESFNAEPIGLRESEERKIARYENEKAEIEDYLFDQYMKQQLIENFFDELANYLEDDAVDEIRGVLAKYNDDEIYAAMSLPHELREKKFTQMKSRIEHGVLPAALGEELVALSKKYGFGIGYHTSPNEILPDARGRWFVKGTENDHRDGDLSRAYYSTKYRHLFKKKSPKFIYMVRTEPDTHRTDGNWHRASTLPIIAKVPFSEVVNYVQSTAKEIIEKEKPVDRAA